MKEKMKQINKGIGGFTLVELIVVLVILSVLAAVTVPSVLGFIDDSKAKECQSQVKALAEEVTAARMSYEVDGMSSKEAAEMGKTPFDVQEYINGAGDAGRCPVNREDVYQYIYDDEEKAYVIACPKGHGKGVLSGSGKFTVAVVEDEDKRESKDETEPESTPTLPDPPKKKSYKAVIDPESLNLETSGENSSKDLSVKVVDEETGEPLPDGSYTVQWHYPQNGCVTGGATGSNVTVQAQHADNGEIYCTVTVNDDETGSQSVESNHVDVTVTDPTPDLHLQVEDLEVEAGKGGNINAWATDGKGGNYPGNVDFTYTCEDPNLTVDGNGNVTCEVPGEYTVTVTATDANDSQKNDTKTVTVKVGPKETEPEESKNSSGLDPNTFHLWIYDEGAIQLDRDPEFSKLLQKLPAGIWSYVSGEGGGLGDNRTGEDLKLFTGATGATGPFTLHYKSNDGTIDGDVTITIGYPITKVNKPDFSDKNQKAVGDEVECYTTLVRPYTTDVPVQWKVAPDSTAQVTWEYMDDIRTRIKIRTKSEGTFRMQAYVHCVKTDTDVLSELSDPITVGNVNNGGQNQNQPQDQNPGITGVTLNPSSMTLKEGQSGQIEAILQTNGDIDMSKVSYKFYNYNTYALRTSSSGGTTATVTGLHAMANSDQVCVDVYYDNQLVANAQCSLMVVSLSANETSIDGNIFEAQSWAWFKQQVKNNENDSYKLNQHHWEENEDTTILFYYDYWDNSTGTMKRDLYIAQGNSANIEKSDVEKVPDGGSFKDCKNEDGKDLFYKVNLENIIEVKYEDLTKDDTKYPCGTVVKVERSPGVYEYYVAYDKEGKKTRLDTIVAAESMSTSGEKKESCAWWKLNALS